MDVASALKSEILRLAKKVVRQEMEPFRSVYASQRKQIADLKKQISVLQRTSKRSNGSSEAAARAPAVESADGIALRFSSKGLRSHRLRLGLSQAQFAKLFGVSAQSIYNWESGAGRPNDDSIVAFAEIRSMGKRQAQARLSELN